MDAFRPVKWLPADAKLGDAVGWSHPRSLKLRVFVLGLLQNGDIGIGVFPLAEKILVGALRFGGVACHRVGTCESDMRECPQREIQDDTAEIEEFLELGSGCGAVVGKELGLAAQ